MNRTSREEAVSCSLIVISLVALLKICASTATKVYHHQNNNTINYITGIVEASTAVLSDSTGYIYFPLAPV